MDEQIKKRDSSVDLMRFIGLTCIVLAHIGLPQETALFQSRTFDVPLMVFTSGLAFAGKTTGSYLPFIWKRTLRLVVPVYVFVTAYCLLNPLLSGWGLVDLYTSERIWGAFRLKLYPSIGYVWIIRVFLIVMLVTPVLVRLADALKKEISFAGVVCAMFVLQYFLIRWLDTPQSGWFVKDWLLFASMVEAAVLEFTGECDVERLKYGVGKFRDHWYKGDSFYGDGQSFSMDYYNSYVIHPMLGRSISACRCGTFQVLSQAALFGSLPQSISPGQARSALTAVIVRQFENPDNFDAEGWLRIGFAGSQPDMAENYVNTGSLYHCTTAFLALGLPADDPFWTEPFEPWTGMKVWSGAPVAGDHALKE